MSSSSEEIVPAFVLTVLAFSRRCTRCRGQSSGARASRRVRLVKVFSYCYFLLVYYLVNFFLIFSEKAVRLLHKGGYILHRILFFARNLYEVVIHPADERASTGVDSIFFLVTRDGSASEVCSAIKFLSTKAMTLRNLRKSNFISDADLIHDNP